MRFAITYMLYNTKTGEPDGFNRYYECKDASDYARCVSLYKDGEVYLTSVNGKPITSQHYYPSKYAKEHPAK